MSFIFMIRCRLTVLALLTLGARVTHAQGSVLTLDSVPRTYSYPGIGPITWTPARGIKAFIGVPEFSEGPRVLCHDTGYTCEIDVNIRNIGYFARGTAELLKEVQEQFAEITPAPPAGAKYSTTTSDTLVQSIFVDVRSGAKYKYTAMAIVIKGPAVLQVVAQAADSSTLASMLGIALNAKGGAFREMLSYRFTQITGACATRLPATRAANERSLQASPFNEAFLLQAERQRDSTITLVKLHAVEAQALSQFITTLDELTPQKRADFCGGLPALFAVSARKLGL